MKLLLILFSTLFLFGCKKNRNRIETMSANGGEYYVKKYFKNNSKTKIEVYRKPSILVYTKEFENKILTKFVEYYPNKKIKVLAEILHKPDFLNAKTYFQNGKLKGRGSYLYNYETDNALITDYWIYYNANTSEADSIVHYFCDGKNTSIATEVQKIDNKNHKSTKIKYFDVKLKDSVGDFLNYELRKVKTKN
ncbi:hypothetical protein Q73A0000_05715 [Kaistella flava (ex Peng et al. 2021)]|uniref:Lipoprotein n=1 Tax=Kaistella flava (ex Peng et al. 2021) TaxID=2038776 RepID=A0A7M2Y896_9FLAO|nr:hypothetical protein [Kaistella flava (ex Peng et al. 2021)]QOW09894.1 hypothetical protein Q73A0000_05715 [Kaistella flava (ex Peng et al. 2021)]